MGTVTPITTFTRNNNSNQDTMNNKSSSRTRINAKRILLTYSQVNLQLTHHHLLEKLKSKLNTSTFNYLIGKQKNQEGGINYHVILIHPDRFDIKDIEQLNIGYKNDTFHGTCSAVRRLRNDVSYVCKENNYITSFKNLFKGRLLNGREFVAEQVKSKGLKQALIDHYQEMGDKGIIAVPVGALDKLFKNIERLKEVLKMDEIKTPFDLDLSIFNFQLQEWIHNPKQTLILVARSGIGNTQFCKGFVKHNNLKTLVVSHRDDLSRISFSYDPIVINNAN